MAKCLVPFLQIGAERKKYFIPNIFLSEIVTESIRIIYV